MFPDLPFFFGGINILLLLQRISGRPIPEARDQEGRIIASGVENDRRFVTVDRGARVHWASGILSLEKDFNKLGVNDDKGNSHGT